MSFALIQAQSGPNPMLTQLPLLLGMGALFYFLLIRPQNKQRKQMEERLSKLKSGDEVILAGGLFATIDRVDEKDAKIIFLKLGTNVVKAKRQAVVALASEPETQN